MKNWKQGLSSLLAVTMLGAIAPAAMAAQVPTTESDSSVVAAIQPGTAANAVNPGYTATTTTTTTTAAPITVGSQVMIRSGARSYSGDSLAAYAYSTVYTVSRFDSTAANAVYISRGGVERARMNVNDLINTQTVTTTVAANTASNLMNGDLGVTAPVNDTYIEGVIPRPSFPVANGVLVRQGTPVLVRAGARSSGATRYLGGAISIDEYVTTWYLNRVTGNHAFLCRYDGGPEVMDINAADVVPAAYDTIRYANLPVTVNAVNVATGAPVTKSVPLPNCTLSALSQDNAHWVRIRDLAWALDGTNGEFEVGTTGAVTNLVHGWNYTHHLNDNKIVWSGDAWGTRIASNFVVDGTSYQLDALYLVGADGYGYTYYRLEDIAPMLGLTVSYGAGITISTVAAY